MPDEKDSALQVAIVPFFGRTLDEYLKLFDLNLADWRGRRILDCPGGASSFTAEAHGLGLGAVACDPLFGHHLEWLRERGEDDIERVMKAVRRVPQLYRWDHYTSVEVLRAYRSTALRRFLDDYDAGLAEGRYVRASLPALPFADRSFDLVLCGHFLFTHSDKFDLDFHRAALRELWRVCAGEVRVYPLQDNRAKPYEGLGTLLEELAAAGIAWELAPVEWEFQRGSNQLLRLARP